MELTRRAFGTAAVGGAAATAGCLEFVLGRKPLSVAASKAEVAPGALDTTGYEHLGTEPVTLAKEFSVAEQTRRVELTNYLSRYRKTVTLPDGTTAPGAVFGTLATPTVEIAGETVDPLAGVPVPELVARSQQLFADVTVQRRLDALQQDVLGSPRKLLQFAALVALSGTQLDALLHLAQIRDAGDVLVLVGMHPRQLSGEAQNVLTLAGALTH